MIEELRKLRQLTETLTGNGYLKDQAEVWGYALDAIPDLIYIINTRFEIKFINKTLAERLNKEKEELYNKLCYAEIDGHASISPPKNWSSCEEIKNTPLVNEIYLDNLKGWFDVTRLPIYTKNDKLIGFICILQDVTDKKVALEIVSKKEATLEAIFDIVPLGIGLVDDKRIIISVNQYLLDLLGYTEKEIVGNSARIFYPSEEEFLRVGKLKKIVISKTGVGALETKFRTKTGKIIDIYLKITRMRSGELLVFTVSDLSSTKDYKINNISLSQVPSTDDNIIHSNNFDTKHILKFVK